MGGGRVGLGWVGVGGEFGWCLIERSGEGMGCEWNGLYFGESLIRVKGVVGLMWIEGGGGEVSWWGKEGLRMEGKGEERGMEKRILGLWGRPLFWMCR